MAFTDNCDIFASFHEDGFNRIIRHVQSQRPSLFNYATAYIAANPELLCEAVPSHPIILARNNPLVTIVDPLPVPGTNYAVNFAIQLTGLCIDFHPADTFSLPPELSPPLQEQRWAIKLDICGGFGCPPKEIVDHLIPKPKETPQSTESKKGDSGRSQDKEPLVPIQIRKLICFSLEAYATGGIRVATYDGKPYLETYLEGFEIVDIKPEGLENSLECYIDLLLKLVVLPGLRILLSYAPLNLTQGATDLFPKPTNVVLGPMPVSAALPNNPAIERDQLKVFIKAEVI